MPSQCLHGREVSQGKKLPCEKKTIAVLGVCLHEQHASIKPELKPFSPKLQPDGHTLALVSPWGDLRQRAGMVGWGWGGILHVSA